MAQLLATTTRVGKEAPLEVEHNIEQVGRRRQPDDRARVTLQGSYHVAFGIRFALQASELFDDGGRTVTVRDEVHELFDLVDEPIEFSTVFGQF